MGERAFVDITCDSLLIRGAVTLGYDDKSGLLINTFLNFIRSKNSLACMSLAIIRCRMLEFKNVSKSFCTGTQRKIILDRVTFRVELGTSFGILAPNDTDKTTLINMMVGLKKPMKGKSGGCQRYDFYRVSWLVLAQNIWHTNSRYI